MLPTVPGQSATVLVALATIGGMPRASSVGKVMSVPPPAIALTAPPAAAASAASRSWRGVGVIGRSERFRAGTEPGSDAAWTANAAQRDVRLHLCDAECLGLRAILCARTVRGCSMRLADTLCAIDHARAGQ